MIKSIVIDLDGVFYKEGGLNYFRGWMQESLQMSAGQLRPLMDKAGFLREAKLGLITEQEMWDRFESQLPPGTDFNRKQAIRELGAGFEIDQALVDYLFSLKAKHNLTLGICSNLEPSSARSRKMHAIEPKGFDFKIYSFEVGLRKPDRRIFELVIDKAGCKAEEIIYIDDQERKLPDEELGIHTHVYENFHKCKEFIEGLL